MIKVYIHYCESIKAPIYVGIGSQQRAYTSNSRNPFWKNHVKKYGKPTVYVIDSLDESDALVYERYLVKLYGRRDLELGTLLNLTDGGDGVHSLSPESAAKISVSSKRPRSPEWRAKIAQTLKGHKMPESARQKLINLYEGKGFGNGLKSKT